MAEEPPTADAPAPPSIHRLAMRRRSSSRRVSTNFRALARAGYDADAQALPPPPPTAPVPIPVLTPMSTTSVPAPGSSTPVSSALVLPLGAVSTETSAPAPEPAPASVPPSLPPPPDVEEQVPDMAAQDAVLEAMIAATRRNDDPPRELVFGQPPQDLPSYRPDTRIRIQPRAAPRVVSPHVEVEDDDSHEDDKRERQAAFVRRMHESQVRQEQRRERMRIVAQSSQPSFKPQISRMSSRLAMGKSRSSGRGTVYDRMMNDKREREMRARERQMRAWAEQETFMPRLTSSKRLRLVAGTHAKARHASGDFGTRLSQPRQVSYQDRKEDWQCFRPTMNRLSKRMVGKMDRSQRQEVLRRRTPHNATGSPSHNAAHQGYTRMLSTRIRKHGAETGELLEQDASGNTPLHLAACAGRCDIVRLLCAEAPSAVVATATVTNKDGDSPLHMAANCAGDAYAELVELILATYGEHSPTQSTTSGPLAVQNAQNLSPVELARQRGVNERMIELLGHAETA